MTVVFDPDEIQKIVQACAAEYGGDSDEKLLREVTSSLARTYPGQINRLHFPFDDPARTEGDEEDQMVVFRRVRDEIKVKFEAYAAERRKEFSGESGD